MAKFGLSQPLRRIEDPRLLKGGGRYTDDIAVKSGAARSVRVPGSRADGGLVGATGPAAPVAGCASAPVDSAQPATAASSRVFMVRFGMVVPSQG